MSGGAFNILFLNRRTLEAALEAGRACQLVGARALNPNIKSNCRARRVATRPLSPGSGAGGANFAAARETTREQSRVTVQSFCEPKLNRAGRGRKNTQKEEAEPLCLRAEVESGRE